MNTLTFTNPSQSITLSNLSDTLEYLFITYNTFSDYTTVSQGDFYNPTNGFYNTIDDLKSNPKTQIVNSQYSLELINKTLKFYKENINKEILYYAYKTLANDINLYR